MCSYGVKMHASSIPSCFCDLIVIDLSRVVLITTQLED